MRLTLERQVPLLFLIAIIILAVILFFTFRSMSSLNESLYWEKHTQKVLLQLDETFILISNAESSVRGFLISQDETLLQPFNEAQQKITPSLTELKSLITDNQAQIEKYSKLEETIQKRMKLFEEMISVRRVKNLEETRAQFSDGNGRALANLIQQTVREMKIEEQNLLIQRENDLNDSLKKSYRMLYATSFAGFFLLGLASIAIYREISRRREVENDLRDINKNLELRVEERTSELSRKNEELKEQIKQREYSEKRHRLALDAGSLGTWMVNPHTNTSEIDERGLSLFGFSAEDFNGNPFERVFPEDAERVSQLFQKSITENQFFNVEFRVSAADGVIRWNNCVGQPVLDENGKVAHIVGNCRDITNIKESEAELKNSEEFSRSIFENSPDCVKILELDGTLHSMNKNGLCIMEIENFEEFAGKQWVDFWEGDESEMAYQAVRSASEGKTIHFEGFCKTAKGTQKWWDVSVAPIFDGNGKPIRLISTSRDISERREVEREREKLLKNEQAARKDAEIANRMRDEFLATVSHELRAPLNSILGWGRLLEKGNLDEATSAKAIQTIVRNADSQNRLIEDLLDVSRIISGKLRLEVITIKPIIFVEAALESVRPAAEAKNITLEVIEDSIVSHISGDPNRLQQVVWNLLSNAIKFTPKGGKVTVEIQRMNGHLEIRVKDTGVGIGQDFLPHVFDRFRQADASSIRKFGGLGLGLAIVRHIAEMHGGTVFADSAGENQGSTFTVQLPVIPAPQDEDEKGVKSVSNNLMLDDFAEISLDGLLILVVDDEEDTRQLLVQSLTFHGATVVTAKSAEEGLNALQEKSPDVLVSDIGMPDEDGYSLIRKIRALSNEHQKNTIAIALTAFTRAQDRMRALAAGFQNHVGKPIEPDELVTVIASLTGRLQTEENR